MFNINSSRLRCQIKTDRTRNIKNKKGGTIESQCDKNRECINWGAIDT